MAGLWDPPRYTPTFTLDALIAKVREIVAARFMFIYEPVREGADCTYVTKEKKPDCLMAQALYALGVPLDYLSLWESQNVLAILENGMGFDGESDSKITMQLRWLNHVQNAQDQLKSWGECVSEADEWEAAFLLGQQDALSAEGEN